MHDFNTQNLQYNKINSQKRTNERNTNNKDNNALHLSERSDEPLYFNITEENPVNWRNYVDASK